MHPVHYAKVLKGAVKRNLQVDLNYKFQLVTDVIDMLLIIVAFTVLGAFVDDAADPGDRQGRRRGDFGKGGGGGRSAGATLGAPALCSLA